jgi:subfamily B ATP-binding cassette protein MsbA
LRFEGIEKLAGAQYVYFSATDSGKIQNTMSGEIERIIAAFRSYMAAIQAVVMVLVYLFLAFLSNPLFAVLVGIGGGLSFLLFKNIYRKTKQTSIQMTEDSHE